MGDEQDYIKQMKEQALKKIFQDDQDKLEDAFAEERIEVTIIQVFALLEL